MHSAVEEILYELLWAKSSCLGKFGRAETRLDLLIDKTPKR